MLMVVFGDLCMQSQASALRGARLRISFLFLALPGSVWAQAGQVPTLALLLGVGLTNWAAVRSNENRRNKRWGRVIDGCPRTAAVCILYWPCS